MAHTGIYATSAECIFKMGKGYDSVNVNEAVINSLNLQVESFINDLCRHVFAIDASEFSALASTKKGLLSETASNFCGFYGAMYSSLGYASTREQEDIMNTCWARYIQCIGLLKNQETVTFIK
jgi:hypothetical protein